MNRALLTSDSAEWGTPRTFYEWLNAQLAFTIDVCAQPTNAKHRRFFTPKDNGLSQSWEGETAWCNPPYGRGIGPWLDKARNEAMNHRALVTLLVPARVDADWWQHFVMSADGGAGRLVRSWFDPESHVLWLRWAGLITGVYFHDQRLDFDGEAGTVSRGESATFPSAVVFHASPSRRPAIERPTLADGQRWLTKGWPR